MRDEQYMRWCKDDTAAVDFLSGLGALSQLADDFADGDVCDENLQAEMAHLLHWAIVDMPRNPFFRAYQDFLTPVMSAALLSWDASNRWAASENEPTQMYAYVLRESMEQVFYSVATIIGGFDHARLVVDELHERLHVEEQQPFASWQREIKEDSDAK